jgi:hypothetical protein
LKGGSSGVIWPLCSGETDFFPVRWMKITPRKGRTCNLRFLSGRKPGNLLPAPHPASAALDFAGARARFDRSGARPASGWLTCDAEHCCRGRVRRPPAGCGVRRDPSAGSARFSEGAGCARRPAGLSMPIEISSPKRGNFQLPTQIR